MSKTSHRVLLLLSCHSLEDFPTWHQGTNADQLLTYWTAPWHPSLLAATGEAPRWRSFDHYDLSSELDVSGSVVVLCPDFTLASLSDDLRQSIDSHPGVTLIHESLDRLQLAERVHQQLNAQEGKRPDPELVGDFFSLGYAYLQVELQTRHMHYSSHLDMDRFEKELYQAASAATGGDPDSARRCLEACFQLLAAERDQYYPVTAHILDIQLVAHATDATQLERIAERADSRSAVNLWMSGDVVEYHARNHPGLIATLRSHLSGDGNGLSLLGGEYADTAPPIESREMVLRNFRRADASYKRWLEKSPSVFFRRRFGLTGMLPDLLFRMGFAGAIHATLDDGRFPQCSQARTAWQVEMSELIEAVGCLPLDASLPETYLQFASRMGQSMEMDYVATICLVHWAGSTNPWYEDLVRTSRYGSVLGEFSSLDNYFKESDSNSRTDHFEAEEYRSPYLQQAAEQQRLNPISHLAERWKRVARWQRIASLACWAIVLGDGGPSRPAHQEFEQSQRRLNDLILDEYAKLPEGNELPAAEQQIMELLADSLSVASQGEGGKLVINAESGNLRLPIRSATRLESTRIYCQSGEPPNVDIHVDVPATGFVWLSNQEGQDNGVGDLIVEGLMLRNEFVSAEIDERTGALAVLEDYRTRGNRLAQRLVREGAECLSPGRMNCDTIRTIVSSRSSGVVESSGQLVDPDGACLAEFRQRFSLSRGSRVLRLKLQIRPEVPPTGNPWQNYYACRWALPRSDFQLVRSLHGVRYETAAPRCECPEYFEIVQPQRRTTILTGGVMYHRRRDERMLDSLLIVTGETSQEFEFAAGVDLVQPLVSACSWFLPTLEVESGNAPLATEGWLFHVDCRHVVATGWEPILESDHCSGFRVRLLETSGRNGGREIPIGSTDWTGLSHGFSGRHAKRTGHRRGRGPNQYGCL